MNYYCLMLSVFSLYVFSYGMEKKGHGVRMYSEEETKEQVQEKKGQKFCSFFHNDKNLNVTVSLVSPIIHDFLCVPFFCNLHPVIGLSNQKAIIPSVILGHCISGDIGNYDNNVDDACEGNVNTCMKKFLSANQSMVDKMKRTFRIDILYETFELLPFYYKKDIQKLLKKNRDNLLSDANIVDSKDEIRTYHDEDMIADNPFFTIDDKSVVCANYVINCYCHQAQEEGSFIELKTSHPSGSKNTCSMGCPVSYSNGWWTKQSRKNIENWGNLITIDSLLLQIPLSDNSIGVNNCFRVIGDEQIHGKDCMARELVKQHINANVSDDNELKCVLRNMVKDSLFYLLFRKTCHMEIDVLLSYCIEKKNMVAIQRVPMDSRMCTFPLVRHYDEAGKLFQYSTIYTFGLDFLPGEVFCLFMRRDPYITPSSFNCIYFGTKETCTSCQHPVFTIKKIIRVYNGAISTPKNNKHGGLMRSIVYNKNQNSENSECNQCRGNFPFSIERGTNLLQKICMIMDFDRENSKQYTSNKLLLSLFFNNSPLSSNSSISNKN